MEINLKELGPKHVDVATSCKSLGTLYSELGDFQQARDNHAQAQKCEGNFEQAHKHHTRALDIHLKQLGPEHVEVAASYNNLGTVYSDLGDFQQAKDCHVRALDIRLKHLGPMHVEVANSYNNLGNVCRDLCDFHQAQSNMHMH